MVGEFMCLIVIRSVQLGMVTDGTVHSLSSSRLVASGHNWVEGQGSGPKIDTKEDEEQKFDALGESWNLIDQGHRCLHCWMHWLTDVFM